VNSTVSWCQRHRSFFSTAREPREGKHTTIAPRQDPVQTSAVERSHRVRGHGRYDSPCFLPVRVKARDGPRRTRGLNSLICLVSPVVGVVDSSPSLPRSKRPAFESRRVALASHEPLEPPDYRSTGKGQALRSNPSICLVTGEERSPPFRQRCLLTRVCLRWSARTSRRATRLLVLIIIAARVDKALRQLRIREKSGQPRLAEYSPRSQGEPRAWRDSFL
jgi:hypothetical protein